MRIPIPPEASEREGRVDQIGCKTLSGGAVGRGDTMSFVSGKARVVKAVQDVDGGLGDASGGEEVAEDKVAGQEHELAAVQSGDGFKGAVRGPDPN